MGGTLQSESHQRSNEMKLPSITRQSLSESQNHRCCYCSCTMTLADDDAPSMATREHVIPRAFGGPTEWWNLVAACRECNSLRGHMYAMKFYYMRSRLSVIEIRMLRYDHLTDEDERYKKRTKGRTTVMWCFLERWLGTPIVLARVER